MASKPLLEQKIQQNIANITHLEVVDTSDGCGAKFFLRVISPTFEGKGLLDRHRLINEALKDELPSIHAISMETWTPAQWETKKAKK